MKSEYRYYRLKQFDFNGNFTYSDIRSVNFEIFTEVVILPNPFIREINIMNLPEKGSLEKIQILNTLGQVVFELIQVQVVKDLTFEIYEKLAPGTYFLSFHMDEETLTFPIIKKEK